MLDAPPVLTPGAEAARVAGAEASASAPSDVSDVAKIAARRHLARA